MSTSTLTLLQLSRLFTQYSQSLYRFGDQLQSINFSDFEESLARQSSAAQKEIAPYSSDEIPR